jgi:hypothetical protein
LINSPDCCIQQIRNWYGWHSRAQKCHSRGSGSTLANAIENAATTKKRTCTQKAVEVYQTMDKFKVRLFLFKLTVFNIFQPKIRAAIKEEKARLGEAGLTHAISLNLTKTTASMLFNLESEEVKEEVLSRARKQKG